MRSLPLLLLLLWLTPACAALIPEAAPPVPTPPPQVAVEVYRGALPGAVPEAPASAGAPPAVRFEVFVAATLEGVEDSSWVASGMAGRDSIPVLPGYVTIVVELSPQERVGPFELEPGATARVRLLDFPGARPHTRTWRVERGGEPVGRAFPPPETLPWVEEIAR